jgi:hypothetical protein
VLLAVVVTHYTAAAQSDIAGLTKGAPELQMEPMALPATSDPNPYAPPLADPASDWPVLPAEHWSALHLAAALAGERTMERIIRIAGSIDAEIYYDARLVGEQVYVNGRLRGRSSVWHWTLVAPTIDFFVEGNGFRVPARIEVGVGPSWRWPPIRINPFRLSIAGRVVYAEGKA